MRADRLLSVLLLLQSRRRVTGRQLAAHLEVSARTVHRDIASGHPVVVATVRPHHQLRRLLGRLIRHEGPG